MSDAHRELEATSLRARSPRAYQCDLFGPDRPPPPSCPSIEVPISLTNFNGVQVPANTNCPGMVFIRFTNSTGEKIEEGHFVLSKALGLTIPQSILLWADEVIQ